MKNLKELLALKGVTGTFGVEIEAEGESLPFVEGKWRMTNDGSLRGRFPDQKCEYVFSKPLKYKEAIEAIYELNAVAQRSNSKFNFSFRTSTHVHVNVSDLTWDQYLNLIYLYLILEEPLINFCGEVRKANRFCLTLQAGEGLLDYIEPLFKAGPHMLRTASMERCKYAAINISATMRYGSLEFRGMRGTNDPKVLDTWLRCFGEMKQSAIKFKNPQEVHDTFIKMRPVDFFASIVSPAVAKEMVYDGVEDDIRGNFSSTIQLPYIYSPLKEEKEEDPIPRMKIKIHDQAALDEIVRRQQVFMRAVQQDPPFAGNFILEDND